MVRRLIELGAVALPDHKGMRPEDVAREQGRMALAAFLEKNRQR